MDVRIFVAAKHDFYENMAIDQKNLLIKFERVFELMILASILFLECMVACLVFLFIGYVCIDSNNYVAGELCHLLLRLRQKRLNRENI